MRQERERSAVKNIVSTSTSIEEPIALLLERALADEERGLGALKLTAQPESLARIAAYSSGDARSAYNVLEIAATLAMEAQQAGVSGGSSGACRGCVAASRAALRQNGRRALQPDFGAAQVGSISDPDAALYWLARMLECGEDPMYLARRIVRMAVEDISLADPHALEICMAARDALDFMGLPEGDWPWRTRRSIWRLLRSPMRCTGRWAR